MPQPKPEPKTARIYKIDQDALEALGPDTPSIEHTIDEIAACIEGVGLDTAVRYGQHYYGPHETTAECAERIVAHALDRDAKREAGTVWHDDYAAKSVQAQIKAEQRNKHRQRRYEFDLRAHEQAPHKFPNKPEKPEFESPEAVVAQVDAQAAAETEKCREQCDAQRTSYLAAKAAAEAKRARQREEAELAEARRRDALDADD